MKKNHLIILILILVLSIIIIHDYKKTNLESDIEGKEITKEEYLFKDDLLNIGYSIDDIKKIASNIDLSTVKKYFLEKKYEDLTKYIFVSYFNPEHIERYYNYAKKHSDYSLEEIVLYVEIGLDKDFYTNINEITDYKSVTTLINKYNKLPDNYSFDDLVTIDNSDKKVRKIMYEPLMNMINDAKKDGINLNVISAYRTNEYQDNLFNNSVKKNGTTHALLYSAKKGHSEHQLGLAVDFNSLDSSFDETKEYEWLNNNAFKYGFIKRYPKNKEFITGFGYEPWHYRYLGVDIATKIYNEKITFEEYTVKYLK